MKKVLLVLGALLAAVSGVAMVSAYEAHTINTTAHVENALAVIPMSVDFGTVFPQEWFIKDVSITTSISFCADNQTRVGDIYYKVYVAWKPLPIGYPGYPGYYPWLGEALYLGIDVIPANPKAPDLTHVGAAPTSQPGAKPALGDAEFVIHKYPPPPDENILIIGLDVPVFEDYWNEHTDTTSKPSGLTGPSYKIPTFDPDGVELGLEIIIQVTRIE